MISLLVVFILIIITIFIFIKAEWIKGLFIEKKIKSSNLESPGVIEKKFNSKVFFITIGAFILVLILLIFLKLNNNIEIDTINYLNNKYGDCGFKIVKVDKHYGYSGFEQYLIGYNVTVHCSSINKNFEVETGKPFSDNLLKIYYKDNYKEYWENFDNFQTQINKEIDKLENYLNKYNRVSIKRIDRQYYSYDDKIFNSSVVPDNYGKIPTIIELFEFAKENILNYELELIVDEGIIDMKVYSIDEAKEVLETLMLDPKVKYTLSGLTVYHNKEIFKKYDSQEELMDNLIYDLIYGKDGLGSSYIICVKKIRNALMNYYSEIASHIIEYYPNVSSYIIKSDCKGYIFIDSNKIYIDAYKTTGGTADIVKYPDKIINR